MWLIGLSSIFPSRVNAGTGQVTDYIDSNGRIRLQPSYKQHLTQLLDKAQARGLKVNFPVLWEQDGICGAYQNKARMLHTWNAYDYGVEIAQAIGNHPAVGIWIFGGDAETCYAEVEVWRNLSQGLKANGANQQIAYHTASSTFGLGSPNLNSRHIKWATESWLNILYPQTGQCPSPANSQAQLQALKTYTQQQGINKPIHSSEMRYETTKGQNPTFCNPRTNLDAAAHRADALGALNAGVNALVYGHHDRWQWGHSELDPSVGAGGGFSAVRNSFNDPGELQYLDVLKQ